LENAVIVAALKGKTGPKMQENRMLSICEKLQAGQLSHYNTEHVIEQLAAEGKRRIDAFVFEMMFKFRLKTIANNVLGLTVSFGWHLGYNKYRNPLFWFRVMDHDDDWNACDDAMLARLVAFRAEPYKRETVVFRVRYEPVHNEFIASRYTGSAWKDWEKLETVIARLPLRKGARPVRPMDNIDPASASTAFDWLRKSDLHQELVGLSIQRRFMNCVLGPGLGMDGTDLDAVVLTPSGDVRCVEFKRKYPAMGANKSFGLDKRPHVATVETMGQMNINTLHIILVGPKWDKVESPVTWLNDSRLDPYWTWLAADLNGDAFERASLRTVGSDSGHRVGERTQSSIKWEKIRLLNEGLSLSEAGRAQLVELLLHGTMHNAPSMDYVSLFNRRAPSFPRIS
jgi:hypothetical protein